MTAQFDETAPNKPEADDVTEIALADVDRETLRELEARRAALYAEVGRMVVDVLQVLLGTSMRDIARVSQDHEALVASIARRTLGKREGVWTYDAGRGAFVRQLVLPNGDERRP